MIFSDNDLNSLINALEGYLIPKSDEKSENKLSLSFLKRKNNNEHWKRKKE